MNWKINKVIQFSFCDVIGVNSNECESVSGKQEMSEEFEANTVDSLVDLPFATVDIKDDSESKYFIK